MTSSQRVAVVTAAQAEMAMKHWQETVTYATMRSLHKGENVKSLAQMEELPLKTVQLDVTDDISVKNAIQSITAESNRCVSECRLCSSWCV